MVLRKDELEVQLKDEHQMIKDGVLKEDSPLDSSEEFLKLCDSCRRGDLKGCQEMIATGVNINARDQFDYTPLILASLCGHYEIVQLLLEAGALCERDTFQGERCLYNALNNRIRNLLLSYDYSKSTDPLQPLAFHVTSLLSKTTPRTSDISLIAGSQSFRLHKFVLSARSPYFRQKLSAAPETAQWRLAQTIPPAAFEVAIRYLYLGEVPSDLGIGPRSFITEEEVFKGIDKISKQLEIQSLWEGVLSGNDRRIARQRHQEEVTRGRDQIEAWYRDNVLRNKMTVDASKVNDVRWTKDNSIFADILLYANVEIDDKAGVDVENQTSGDSLSVHKEYLGANGIPIGPSARSRSPSTVRKRKTSSLFPAHRAMLIRSEYFLAMFSSEFQEAQETERLQIVSVDCSPEVLEIVLTFLYTEKADFGVDVAIDVLYVADMLLMEKLKTKAAVIISTLGNGNQVVVNTETTDGSGVEDVEVINVYDVLRAGWLTRSQRLETFAARYLANRLEDYIDEQDFEDLIRESAYRIEHRQDTDTIELLDDIRHYLSERFRLRFEDSCLQDIMEDDEDLNAAAAQSWSESIATKGPSDTEKDEAIDVNPPQEDAMPPGDTPAPIDADPNVTGEFRTLDGQLAGDEFASDAINYEILLNKIDRLLERLELDA